MSTKTHIIGSHTVAFKLNTAPSLCPIGANTMAIFSKNNKMWFAKEPISDKDADLFKIEVEKHGLQGVNVHACYLINLASSDDSVREKSIKSLSHELERCSKLGISYLVLHPGSHTGGGVEKGIQLIVQGLDEVLSQDTSTVQILLETAAGQGTQLATTTEQLWEIYNKCTNNARLGFCLDTCHIFAAGYDIGTDEGYDSYMANWEKIIGWDLLKVIHLNDSKDKVGAKKDRHEAIGHGNIPIRTFWRLMNDARIAHVPLILETPVKNVIHAEEIKLLRSMIGAEKPPEEIYELKEETRRERSKKKSSKNVKEKTEKSKSKGKPKKETDKKNKKEKRKSSSEEEEDTPPKKKKRKTKSSSEEEDTPPKKKKRKTNH